MFSISKTSVKMAILAVVTVVGAVQVGCTNREIASGVIGAVLVDSIYRSNPPPQPRYGGGGSCVIERREHCGVVSDYWGNPIHRCVYRTWDSCGGGWRKAAVGSKSAADLDAAAIAETYQLTEDGAAKFVNALSTAQNAQSEAGASEAFATIGLNIDEAKALGTSGTPSADMIDRLAKALNQNPKHTAMMVASISETAREQQAARQNNQN